MGLEPWLPSGHQLPDGARTQAVQFEGSGWQIVSTRGGGAALLAQPGLAKRWMDSRLLDGGELASFTFGKNSLLSLSCGPSQVLSPVSDGKSPDSKSEALSFAMALRVSREIDQEAPLQDAIYVEKISRLLPTYSISAKTDDDLVLGYWLTGGANVSAKSFRRMRQMLSWLGASNLRDVIEAGGFTVDEAVAPSRASRPQRSASATPGQPSDTIVQAASASDSARVFELPGRPALAGFFNEHIVDIVLNRERYSALGINFPSALVLHGPPGCGKTFAVEKLIEFLGWPSFSIDASSVASPYIHDTSKKVAEVFEKAIQNSPSVLVIDEMEAFLADREMGSGHHRVEEVAEFLRRIPEAAKNDVLVVAMTNRVEMIDPAILRRGRFDHVIQVGFASETEIQSLLEKLLSAIPKSEDVVVGPLAKALAGRPLSDVSFVVREAARLAARAGKSQLDNGSLEAALSTAPARSREGSSTPTRRIGFV